MIVDQTYRILLPEYPLDLVISFTQKASLFKQEVKAAMGLKTTKELNVFNSHFSHSDYKNRAKTARLSSGNVIVSLTSIDHGIIAHEVLHAATLYLDAVGVVFSMDSNEVYAYFIQYITTIIYKIIEENEGVFSTERNNQGFGSGNIQDQTTTA